MIYGVSPGCPDFLEMRRCKPRYFFKLCGEMCRAAETRLVCDISQC